MAHLTAMLGVIVRWMIGFLMVVVAPIPALSGYFAAACPAHNPLGMAIVTVLAFAVRFPLFGVLFILCAIFCWPVAATAAVTRSLTRLLAWWAVTISCIGLVSWLFSTLLGATTRCSLLW